MKKTKLMLGDNIQSLKKLPDNSIDSIVTDPPYGLSFMGKKWDYDVPSVDFWKEVYRVLKPGGHILSFGGTRTYHRMVVNIEDAGFEIRDQVMWLYGSGFPKSHNISKSLDKLDGVDVPQGKAFVVAGQSGQRNLTEPTPQGEARDAMRHKPTNENALKYEGWGTALKPANEPICVARKPLSEKTVAENVLKWRTGGINIDGCRVGTETIKRGNASVKNDEGRYNWNNGKSKVNENYIPDDTLGRFPANLILECICDEVIKGDMGEKTTTETNINNKEANWFRNAGGDKEERWSFNDKGDIHTNPMCPCRMLDEQSGVSKSNCKSGVVEGKEPGMMYHRHEDEHKNNNYKQKIMVGDYNDKGGASRFFYVAKVSKKERNLGLDGFDDKLQAGAEFRPNHMEKALNGEDGNPYGRYTPTKNNHPTLKPINLMTYLCRLVTPENGIVLDPFMGSGSTGISALLEGFRFVGMELDPDYFKIAEARIESYEKYRQLVKNI